PLAPAGRAIPRINEHHDGIALLGVVRRRHKEVVLLLGRVVIAGQPVGWGFLQALVGQSESPVDTSRATDFDLCLETLDLLGGAIMNKAQRHGQGQKRNNNANAHGMISGEGSSLLTPWALIVLG